ncbi:MAG: hypothetical protein HYY13_11650 [Nitrospirae bacterium]|nr:hypothetical protein [Nitrospirota bacterium]
MFRAMGYRTPRDPEAENGPELKRLLDAFSMKGGLSFNVTRSSRCVDKEVSVESVDAPGHSHGGSTGITIFCNKEDAVQAAEVNIGSIPIGVAPIRREKSPKRHVETVGDFGADSSKTRIGFSAPEVDIFSTAPFGRYYSTFFDVRFDADEGKADIHMANVRGVFGEEVRFLQVKAGVMHPVEGLGGLDNPVGFSAPLVTSAHSEGNAFSFIHPSQIGVMLGGGISDSLASISLFNGLDPDGNGVSGFSAQNNSFDTEIHFIRFIGDAGGAVQTVGYLGNRDQPKDKTNPDAGTFRNTFWRGLLAANYAPLDAFNLLGGVGGGVGKGVLAGSVEPFNSWGFYGEADLAVWDHFIPWVRYDFYDPADDEVAGTHALTVGFSSPHDFQRLVVEYQYMRTTGDDALRMHVASAGWDFAF